MNLVLLMVCVPAAMFMRFMWKESSDYPVGRWVIGGIVVLGALVVLGAVQ